ncbi:protein O-mannosyl-transferase Tmtc3-like [Ornithodoros turicata]|uniref:protein O-mannosyl-transferase Tmtc3-like n=1 Tax=Ornithodoros turicata TaxID=34597 RepID=UPI00313899AB
MLSDPVHKECHQRERECKRVHSIFTHWHGAAASTAIVAATACSAYASALGAGLVYDDIAAITKNRDIRPTTPITNLLHNDFWGTPLTKEESHKSYRPLTVLTYRINYAVHGLEPFGYHLVNVLLHCFVCILYHRTCLSLVPSFTSFLAALLFSVHPIHTEAVASVVGRAELLCALFFLCALYFYIYSAHVASIQCALWRQCLTTVSLAAAAMLCKEQGLTVLAVCCIFDLISHKQCLWGGQKFMKPRKIPKDSVYRVCILGASGVLVLWWRLLCNGPHTPVFSQLENPASAAEPPWRQLTNAHLAAVNAWLLLFPSSLCCDWTMGSVPLVTSLVDARNFATVLTFCIFGAALRAALRAEGLFRGPMVMALAMLVIPYIPASNLFFPVGFVIAERILYLPSMGFCLVVALGFTRLCRNRQYEGILKICLVTLLVSHVTKTFFRNYDWWSEESLYSAALRVNDRNAKMYNNMGQALENLSRHHEAYELYKKAIEIQPDDIRGHLNLGRLLITLERYTDAENVLQKARYLLPKQTSNRTQVLRATTTHLQVFLSIASLISRDDNRLQQADQLYKQVIHLRSDFTEAYMSRGDFLLRTNRTVEAQHMYEIALKLDDTNPDLLYNLGLVHMEQGHAEEAMKLFNRALALNPRHQRALISSAALLHRTGRRPEKNTAIERLEKVIQDNDHEDGHAYFRLAMMALENNDTSTAEMLFRRTVAAHPGQRSALFNLALLLSDQERPMEAMGFLRELLKYHPNHIEGLVLLGDISVRHLRDLEAAEECYLRILSLNPRHVQGSHNLCVVYVERGELSRAERCFLHAITLDPNADYIRHHLKVTQNLLLNRTEDPTSFHTSTPSKAHDFSTSSKSR